MKWNFSHVYKFALTVKIWYFNSEEAPLQSHEIMLLQTLLVMK